MATLNARRSITSKIDENSSHMMLSMPSSINHQPAGTGSKVQSISIRIDTLKEAEVDSDHMVTLILIALPPHATDSQPKLPNNSSLKTAKERVKGQRIKYRRR